MVLFCSFTKDLLKYCSQLWKRSNFHLASQKLSIWKGPMLRNMQVRAWPRTAYFFTGTWLFTCFSASCWIANTNYKVLLVLSLPSQGVTMLRWSWQSSSLQDQKNTQNTNTWNYTVHSTFKIITSSNSMIKSTLQFFTKHRHFLLKTSCKRLNIE